MGEVPELGFMFLFFLTLTFCYVFKTETAGTFLSEFDNRETIVATEANNDTYCLQNNE